MPHMTIILAATHHDAEGRQEAQIRRVLPVLQQHYAGMLVLLTPQTVPTTAELLDAAQVGVACGADDWPVGHLHLGLWRRKLLAAALQQFPGALIHFCDFDRVLHWAEFYPDELTATLRDLPQADFTVLGRTPAAFASHPRAQRETEALINEVFARVSGWRWDVAAASRGLSAAAAAFLVAHAYDDSIGNDCSWPLLLRQQTSLRLAYRAVDGLAFETLDRFAAEVAALGGAQAWCDQFDADPRQWLYRLELARAEMLAALQFYDA
jgi:hypothetical protein